VVWPKIVQESFHFEAVNMPLSARYFEMDTLAKDAACSKVRLAFRASSAPVE